MENPVNTWFKLPVETKQNIFNSISLQEGLPVQSVEKVGGFALCCGQRSLFPFLVP